MSPHDPHAHRHHHSLPAAAPAGRACRRHCGHGPANEDAQERLRRALAALNAALAAQREAVAGWRGALGKLRGSVQDLHASLQSYNAKLGALGERVGTLNTEAKRLEAWADGVLQPPA